MTSTTSIEDRIVAAYIGGSSIEQIAADIGRSFSTVQGILKRYKVQIRPARRPMVIPEGSVAETRIVAAYAQGFSMRRIAGDEHVSYGSIRNVLVRNGVKLRARGGDIHTPRAKTRQQRPGRGAS